jgi:predicted Zn-dependent protease
MQRAAIISLASFVWLAGCSVNPVTGDRDFILLSGQQEVAMGIQNYVPMQQSQGGVYDVDPALTAYVESVGQKLAAVSDVPLPYEFVVLNNSVPNAWALPGGKIAINRGLLTELKSESELAAVLGHEVVHAAARHSAQQMSRGMLTQGLVVATTVATNDSSYRDLAAMGAGLAGQLALSKYGRSAELESDKYGMRYMSAAGYDPQGAVTLQETFVRLSEGRDQDWLSGLFASHPPSQERVDENRRRAGNLPAGGILGVESFNAAMRKTMAAKPAYDIYDNGRKALGEKKNDEALALANEALTLFPDEAHFHALRGDVRLMNKQFDMAVTAFSIITCSEAWPEMSSAGLTARLATSSTVSNCYRQRPRTIRWAKSRKIAGNAVKRLSITRSLPRVKVSTVKPHTAPWCGSNCRHNRRRIFLRLAGTMAVAR